MATDDKEQKGGETQQPVKQQQAEQPKIPASARKPGQNYSSTKFNK